MKLLIVTQTVDKNDPYLGFFHQWIKEFASRYESIIVICLTEGEHTLPSNVRVLSLGKGAAPRGKLRYSARFISYVWRERHSYDAVFVHMNEEYVLLAGLLWRALQKPVYLWRNHYAGSWRTRLAGVLSSNIFYTSRYSYTARLRKAVRMPVGVELNEVSTEQRTEGSILFYGRIAESKRPELLLDALTHLSNAPEAVFCGPGEEKYIDALKKKAGEQGVRALFKPGIPHSEAPRLLAQFEVYVNAARSGMLDKTIFEAAAAGAIPLSSSRDWAEAMPNLYFEDASTLAEKLAWLQTLPKEEKDTLRAKALAIARGQSLPFLMDTLQQQMVL